MSEHALRMFRAGMDTHRIAKCLGIPEAKASRLIWIARCQEKNLPAIWLDRARQERKAAA